MEADVRDLVALMLKSSCEGIPKHVEANWQGEQVAVVVVKGNDVEKVKAFLKELEAK